MDLIEEITCRMNLIVIPMTSRRKQFLRRFQVLLILRGEKEEEEVLPFSSFFHNIWRPQMNYKTEKRRRRSASVFFLLS